MDQNLIYGPVKTRSCTNFFCFVLFGVEITWMIILSINSFVIGDPSRLAWPVDADSKFIIYKFILKLESQCGSAKFQPIEEYKYAYLAELNSSKLNKVICVKECPNSENNLKLEFYPNSRVKKQKDGVN